jgi:hypothetical protein
LYGYGAYQRAKEESPSSPGLIVSKLRPIKPLADQLPDSIVYWSLVGNPDSDNGKARRFELRKSAECKKDGNQGFA